MPKYLVNEIFRSIQGEGYHTGRPATFVRFQGCNLHCDFCDTKYALGTGGTEYDDAELIVAIDRVKGPHDIVVFTGGEPTLQPIKDLVTGRTHLETNGTNPVPDGFEWVTVSPKPFQGVEVCTHAMERTNEIKWLIEDGGDVTGLSIFLDDWADTFDGVVSVQPVSCNPTSTKIAMQACLDYGWRLSLQTHKFIKVK